MMLVVACGWQESPLTDGQTTPGLEAGQPRTEEPAVVPESYLDFSPAELRSPLPEGVELPFAYHRLNDNTVDGDTSRSERRVYVEIRKVSAEEAEVALTELLLQKDFSTPEVAVEKGVRELTFGREDGARLTVKINPQRKRPQAPDATGTLHLVWKTG